MTADTATRSRRESRYRLYYRLMDGSTLFIPIAFSLLFWSFPAEWEGLALYAANTFTLITAFFIYLVPIFLIVAAFMRDDYADGLWVRTMKIVGFLAALVPLGLNVVYRVLEIFFEPDGGPIHYAYFYLYNFVESEMTARDAFFIAHIVFLWAFVLTFQFLRWRDSR